MLLVHISFSRVVSKSGTPPFALTFPYPVPGGAELYPLPGHQFQGTMQHSEYPQLQEHITTLTKVASLCSHPERGAESCFQGGHSPPPTPPPPSRVKGYLRKPW